MAASIFKILSSIFKEANISCILIGGYAVNSYKVTRHTADVDFMITKESFEKIKDKLFRVGYSIQHQQDVFVQLVNVQGYRDLDFMFCDQHTFDKFLNTSKDVSIASENFLVPSLEHLIALKLHSIKYNPHRELNDIPDIVNLIKANHLNYNDPDFVKFTEKFGSKEIYFKLLKFLEIDRGDLHG